MCNIGARGLNGELAPPLLSISLRLKGRGRITDWHGAPQEQVVALNYFAYSLVLGAPADTRADTSTPASNTEGKKTKVNFTSWLTSPFWGQEVEKHEGLTYAQYHNGGGDQVCVLRPVKIMSGKERDSYDIDNVILDNKINITANQKEMDRFIEISEDDYILFKNALWIGGGKRRLTRRGKRTRRRLHTNQRKQKKRKQSRRNGRKRKT